MGTPRPSNKSSASRQPISRQQFALAEEIVRYLNVPLVEVAPVGRLIANSDSYECERIRNIIHRQRDSLKSDYLAGKGLFDHSEILTRLLVEISGGGGLNQNE